MFYINQLRMPSFPIGLVKTESGFTVRSVETGLRRWMLVLAMISVDAYPFFGFLRPDLSPWGYRHRCFLVALCRPRGFSISRWKYWGSFNAMFAHGGASLQLFLVRWMFLRSQGVICYDRWVLSEGHKITLRIGISRTHSLPFWNQFLVQWIMSMLSKGSKPDNFEPHNSLKLSFAYIWDFCSKFLNVNLSVNQTLLTFLLYVRQTWMTQLILAISLWGPIFL